MGDPAKFDGADQMAGMLCRILTDAFQIEGVPYKVQLVTDQELRLIGPTQRFGVKVVLKRGR